MNAAWRPRNESAADLERENAAKLVIERAWRVTGVKLSETLYGVDWAFGRGGHLQAWGEFKARKQRYPTLLLSYAKWSKGMELWRWSGAPFVLFIEWPDGLWYVRNPKPTRIEFGGNSRGQNGDIEPVVHIPVDAFVRLTGEG